MVCVRGTCDDPPFPLGHQFARSLTLRLCQNSPRGEGVRDVWYPLVGLVCQFFYSIYVNKSQSVGSVCGLGGWFSGKLPASKKTAGPRGSEIFNDELSPVSRPEASFWVPQKIAKMYILRTRNWGYLITVCSLYVGE